MQHLRHRIQLFTEITQGEARLAAMVKDGTYTDSERSALQQQLDQKRAELADYSRDNAEVMVAEEVAIMEANSEIFRDNEQLRVEAEAAKREQDHLREEIQKRDEWVTEHGTPEQQAEYDWQLNQQDQGHTR